MALIPCPACEKQVSKKAPTCPNCGHPIAAPAAPPEQRVVVEQSSGAGGLGCVLLILVLLGGAAFVLFKTEFGKELLDKGLQLTDSQRIVGKWKQQDGPLELEFFSDGSLSEVRAFDKAKGTYKMLGNGRMELKIGGVLWGQNEATVRYTLSGDELTLTPDAGVGLTIRYRRVK